MPGEIAAVVQQAGELDPVIDAPVENEMARGFHSFACHAVAAERQVIDISVRCQTGRCFGTWSGRIFQQVAQRLADQLAVAVGSGRTEVFFAPGDGFLNVLSKTRKVEKQEVLRHA